MKCQDCGKEDETVHETICPYAADIYDEEISVILCEECVYERAMDI